MIFCCQIVSTEERELKTEKAAAIFLSEVNGQEDNINIANSIHNNNHTAPNILEGDGIGSGAESKGDYHDEFHPTTPGRSPGVGH